MSASCTGNTAHGEDESVPAVKKASANGRPQMQFDRNSTFFIFYLKSVHFLLCALSLPEGYGRGKSLLGVPPPSHPYIGTQYTDVMLQKQKKHLQPPAYHGNH